MFSKVKGIALDFDGVLTDGNFLWDGDGLELKRLCFADVSGIPMAIQLGLKVAIISGDSTESGMAIVQRYAKRMKIDEIFVGCHDKPSAVTEFANKYSIRLDEMCFIGDDLIDIPAMKIVGLAVAPPNANEKVLKIANYITAKSGGNGAVREVIDKIIDERI
jgi:3-deoxy-D-manno-octulosonate 8-phosphate phosphatase (KDO 8-P phosphatase)